MNSQLWWFVARAGGMVAWGLVTLSICWGLLLSTRLVSKTARASWLLDLHRFLSSLAVVFTAIHLISLVLDDFVYFGLRELFIPYAYETQAESVAWGIVAFYLLVAVEVSSLAIRRLPRRLWRSLHRLSFGLYILATIHGYRAGTDADNSLFRGLLIGSVFVVTFLTIVAALTRRSPRVSGTSQEAMTVADMGM